MARRQIRTVIENPQHEYTNFSQGMEYNSHSKEVTNNRVQLIKNLEIASDGKLNVRRLLSPYKDISSRLPLQVTPYEVDLLGVVHAPFSGIEIPFIWVTREKFDGTTHLWMQITKSYGFLEVQGDTAAFNSIITPLSTTFLTTQNKLLIATSDGILKVSFSGTIASAELDPVYTPTISEETSVGPNLYNDKPFFVGSEYTGLSTTSIPIKALLPFKTLNSSIDPKAESFDFTTFTYDVQPTPQDQIYLKAIFQVPRNLLEHEISQLFESSFSGGNATIRINSANKQGLVTLFKNLFMPTVSTDKHWNDIFPLWTWSAEDLDGNIVPLKPASGIQHAFPLLAALSGDINIAEQINFLIDDYFQVPHGTADYESLLAGVGLHIDNRMDLWRVPFGTPDTLKYKLEVDPSNITGLTTTIESKIVPEDLIDADISTKSIPIYGPLIEAPKATTATNAGLNDSKITILDILGDKTKYKTWEEGKDIALNLENKPLVLEFKDHSNITGFCLSGLTVGHDGWQVGKDWQDAVYITGPTDDGTSIHPGAVYQVEVGGGV